MKSILLLPWLSVASILSSTLQSAEAQAPCEAVANAPNFEFEVTDNLTLSPGLCIQNVKLKVSRGDITIDCQGSTLAGAPAAAGKDGELGIHIVKGSAPISNLNIKNCVLHGFDTSIMVRIVMPADLQREIDFNSCRTNPRPDKYCNLVGMEPPPRPLLDYNTVLALNMEVGDRIRARSSIGVTFDNIVAHGFSGNGLKINRYVTGVVFANGNINAPNQSAVYISAGSKDNAIVSSVISGGSSSLTGQGLPTIAIDSSAGNVIAGNEINGSIHVFKNCHEANGSATPEPNTNPARAQHSSDNGIAWNVFRGSLHNVKGLVGVWVAPRTSIAMDSSVGCSDPIYYSSHGQNSVPPPPPIGNYYRDFAERTIIAGNRFEDGRRVVAEDNDAHITDNTFVASGTPPPSYIEIGSRVRQSHQPSEPVIRAVTVNNLFSTGAAVPVSFLYGSVPTPGIHFSENGKIPGEFCEPLNEIYDPDTWNDNFVCSTRDIGIRFSDSGKLPGMCCKPMIEPMEPFEHDWNDNYICLPCSYPMQFEWSFNGPIAGMRCTNFNETADPHTWADNYLCI